MVSLGKNGSNHTLIKIYEQVSRVKSDLIVQDCIITTPFHLNSDHIHYIPPILSMILLFRMASAQENGRDGGGLITEVEVDTGGMPTICIL